MRRQEFDWMSPLGGRLNALITFDEVEAFAGFRKLSPGDTQQPLTLHIEATPTAVTVALRDERYLLPLQKAQIKIVSR